MKPVGQKDAGGKRISRASLAAGLAGDVLGGSPGWIPVDGAGIGRSLTAAARQSGHRGVAAAASAWNVFPHTLHTAGTDMRVPQLRRDRMVSAIVGALTRV